jgi:starvation-inducible DNA-binding protein
MNRTQPTNRSSPGVDVRQGQVADRLAAGPKSGIHQDAPGACTREAVHFGLTQINALECDATIRSRGFSEREKHMAYNIELTEQAKRECAEALSKVLSDTFVLYLKTHNFHWNVEGPRFRGLHMMFEEQYRDLWNSIDDIAERIRALGQPAPGTTARFKELAEIRENDRVPPGTEMLRELMNDNETATRTIRSAISTAQAAGDEATAGLLVDRLTYHEKQLWMMKSMMAS